MTLSFLSTFLYRLPRTVTKPLNLCRLVTAVAAAVCAEAAPPSDGWNNANPLSETLMLSRALTAGGGPTLAIADQATPEIVALAGALGNNPLRMLEWVRNNVEFSPYWGLKRGAHLTLIERRGNDHDQCALLMALLKASNVPASYRSANVFVARQRSDGYDAEHWLDCDSDQLTNMLNYANFIGAAGSNSAEIRVRRVWIVATVGGESKVLDPGFKPRERHAPVDVAASTTYSPSALWSAAGGNDQPHWVMGMNLSDQGGMRPKLTEYAVQLANHLRVARHSESGAAVAGVSESRQEILQSLPNALHPACRIDGVAETWTGIPLSECSKLSLGAGNIAPFEKYTAELQGKKLAIWIVNRRIQIWLDDALLAEESGTLPAEDNSSVTIGFTHPESGNNQSSVRSLDRLQKAAVIIYAFDRTQPRLLRAQERQAAYAAESKDPNSREALTEALHVVGLQYKAQVEALTSVLTGVTRNAIMPLHFAGLVHQKTAYQVDFPLYALATPRRSANGLAPDDAFFLCGNVASAMEHMTIEQSSAQKAISTTKMIEHSISIGDRVFVLDSSTYAASKSNLRNYSTVWTNSVNAIESIIAQGGRLMIPEDSAISYEGVQGPTLFLRSPSPLNEQWVISGGLFGGLSTKPKSPNIITMVLNRLASIFTGTQSSQAHPTTTSSDPVDLSNGAFYKDDTDLVLGNDAEPIGLRLTRSYNSARRNSDPVGLGRGWSHSYNIRLQYRSPVDFDVCRANSADVAPIIVAARTMADIYNSTSTGRAKNYVMTAVAANWMVEQLFNTRASITLGSRNYEFTILPDGTFAAPAGVTAVLVKNGGVHTLSFRHGNSIEFYPLDSDPKAGKFHNITDAFGNTLTASYTTQGKLATVTDARSRTLTFNQPGAELLSVTDSTGRTVSYARDDAGLKVTDVEEKQSIIEQDGDGRLTKVVDARGRTIVQNFYDAWHRVTHQHILGDSTHLNKLWIAPGVGTEVDPAGKAVWTYFDARGRKIFVVNQDNKIAQWHYDGADRLTDAVTPEGNVTSYSYDANHNLTQETNPAGHTRTIQYYTSQDDAENGTNNNMLPKRVGNFEGQFTEFGYNAQHKVTSITIPGSIVSTFEYHTSGNGKGQLAKAHPAAYEPLKFDFYSYDAFGHPTRIERAVASSSASNPADQFTYTSRGDLEQMIDRRGVKTTFDYNNRRQRTAVTAQRGTVNAQGIVTAPYVADATTTIAYDDTGDIDYVLDASSRKTDTEHNALGDVTEVRQGTAQAVVLKNAYNTRNLLETSTVRYDGADRTTTYTYHDTQALKTVTNPLGNSPLQAGADTYTTIFGYDNDLRRTSVTTPLGYVSTTTWDSRSFKDGESDGESRTADYAYDMDGRLKTLGNRRFPEHQLDFVWVYDDTNRKITTKTPLQKTTISILSTRGLPASVQEPSTQTTRFDEYDVEGRLKKKSDDAGETTFTYHANGLLYTVTETPKDSEGHLVSANARTTTRTYDALNRLQSYQDGEGNTISYTYWPSGELHEIVYPGNKTVTYTYDDFGRLWKVTDWTNKTTTYTYWENGLLKKIERPNGTVREQSYDAAGRLRFVRETKSGAFFAFQELTYDADGRITKSFLHPMPASIALPADNMVFDADNCMSTFNSASVDYDADGNLTRGPAVNGVLPDSTNFTYDVRNQLTSHGGSNYRYNPDGLRVEVTGTGAATYVVDPNAALSRTLTRTKNGVTTYYIYGLGLLYECDASGNSARYYHPDQVGSTIALTDASGTITDRWSYSPFGTEFRGQGTTDTPFRFNGEFGVITEASGLVYMRARYYHPRLMRFLNADPIGFAGDMNWYAFVSNNPISRFDPLGLKDSQGNVVKLPDFVVKVRRTAGDIADYAKAAASGAGEGLYYAGRGLVTAPYRVGQGVVSGYQQIGDLIGDTIVDPQQLFNDLLYMEGHRLQTAATLLEVEAAMAAAIAESIAAQAQTSKGRGELWGDATFALFSGGALRYPATNGARLAVHGPHHSFAFFGKASHIQLNWWTKGVRGSGDVARWALPWK